MTPQYDKVINVGKKARINPFHSASTTTSMTIDIFWLNKIFDLLLDRP